MSSQAHIPRPDALQPPAAPAALAPAAALREAGRYREAQAWLAARLEAGGEDAAALALLAHVQLLDNRDEAAAATLARIPALDPALPALWRNLARLAVKRNQPAQALAAAQQALGAEPASAESLLVAASALAAAQRDAEALPLVERVLRDCPDYAEAHTSRALLRLRAGNPAGALEDARRALALKPHLPLWPLVAQLCRQANDLPGAIAAMQAACARAPDNPDPCASLGELLRQDGQAEAAIALLEKTLARFPGCAPAWANLGTALHGAGRLAPARHAYEQALRLKPDLAEARSNLGVLLGQMGQAEDEEAQCRRAVAENPGLAEAHSNLGVALLGAGRLEEAEACYRRALALKPGLAGIHQNLGNLLDALKRHGEAEACFREALRLDPALQDSHRMLGNIHFMQGRVQEAEQCFRSAIALDPGRGDIFSDLGNALKDLGRCDEAEACYRRAVALDPGLALAHNNLGNLLIEGGHADRAEACLRRAIELKPDFAQAHANLGNALKDLGRLAEAEACYLRAIEIKPDLHGAHGSLLFSRNYAARGDPLDNLALARRYGATIAAGAHGRFTEWRCARAPRRLRVGFVSGDLRSHPVGYFLENVLAELAAGNLELFAYPTALAADALSERLKPRFAAWTPLRGLGDAEAARAIHAEGIHVLIDLSGHTNHNRLPLFAWKPAPVQATWLGYFATTGLEAIDYWIGDPHILPPGEAHHFSERPWPLPETYLCFTPPKLEPEPAVSPLPALSAGQVTFGCFNALAKMNDAVVATWAAILRALPAARLLLKTPQLAAPAQQRATLARFAAHGVGAERLVLEGPAPRAELLAAYRRVDIALDPFPYPGGTTSAEALWMGVPVLTLRGDRLVSHIGESILHNAGLPQWIAATPADYADKAARFAADLPALAALRAALRQQALASPLFDAPRFARHFEQALWNMWRKWNERESR